MKILTTGGYGTGPQNPGKFIRLIKHIKRYRGKFFIPNR